MLPALWRAGVDAGRWVALPADAVAAVDGAFPAGTGPPQVVLQQAYRANGARNADLLHQATAVREELAAAGIPTVPLKGLHALLHGWWPDPAVRVLRDLDVLVPAGAAATAVRRLQAMGYRRAVVPDPLADHEVPAMRRAGRAGTVELHVRPLVARVSVLDVDRLLAAGRLTDTEAVLHAIAHTQLQDDSHLLGRLPLRSLFEVAVLAEGPHGPTIDWAQIRAAMRADAAEPALDGFLALARDLFAADVPAPRRRVRAHARAALVKALDARPRAAWTYEKLAFQRRQLDPRRLAVLDPGGHGSAGGASGDGVWALRSRHLAAGVGRTVHHLAASTPQDVDSRTP